jgi:hypothetical protein
MFWRKKKQDEAYGLVTYEEYQEVQRREGIYLNAFLDIMDQETPSANATVKRMAKIARDAMGGV